MGFNTVNMPIYIHETIHLSIFKGDIDVGDGCWRQNVGDRFNTLQKSPLYRKKST